MGPNSRTEKPQEFWVFAIHFWRYDQVPYFWINDVGRGFEKTERVLAGMWVWLQIPHFFGWLKTNKDQQCPYPTRAPVVVAMPRSRCSSVTLMALRSRYGLQPVWGEIRLVLMWWHHWKSLKKTNRHCRCSLPGWWFDLDDPDRLIVSSGFGSTKQFMKRSTAANSAGNLPGDWCWCCP